MMKKHIFVLMLTVLLFATFSSPVSALAWKDYQTARNMAESCEQKGDFSGAGNYYAKAGEYAKALGYKEIAYELDMRIRAIDPMTEVYALTTNTSRVPHFGAKYEPQAGAYFGKIGNGSAISNHSLTSYYFTLGQDSGKVQ